MVCVTEQKFFVFVLIIHDLQTEKSFLPQSDSTVREMESFAIPLERVAGGKSELVAALVKAAEEIKVSVVPSQKEHQLLEAIIESLTEWKRRIQNDCKVRNNNPYETAEALEQVQQGLQLCVLKLRTINELLMDPAVGWSAESPQQRTTTVHKIQRLLFIAEEKEIRSDSPERPSQDRTVQKLVDSTGKIMPPKCYLCRERHYIYHCSQFQGMTATRRLEFAEQNHLCLNCFHCRHDTEHCPKPPRCLYCHGKHHSELHSALAD